MSRLIASMRARKGSGKLRSSKRSTPSRMRVSASRKSGPAGAAGAAAFASATVLPSADAAGGAPACAAATAGSTGFCATGAAALSTVALAALPFFLVPSAAGGGSSPSTLRPPSFRRTRSISGRARRSRVKCQRPIIGCTSANSSSTSSALATGAPSRSCSTSLSTCRGPRSDSTGAPSACWLKESSTLVVSSAEGRRKRGSIGR